PAAVRSVDGETALCGPGDQRPRDEDLQPGGLAMDAERWQDAFDGLEPGKRFPEREVGGLLRTDDDLPARSRIDDASAFGGYVGRVDQTEDQLRGHRIHLGQRPAVYASVFTCLV